MEVSEVVPAPLSPLYLLGFRLDISTESPLANGSSALDLKK